MVADVKSKNTNTKLIPNVDTTLLPATLQKSSGGLELSPVRVLNRQPEGKAG